MNHWEQINADMIFNKERFTLDGKTIYTATAEPTIMGVIGHEKVTIPCKTSTGSHRTIRVPLGTLVRVEKKW